MIPFHHTRSEKLCTISITRDRQEASSSISNNSSPHILNAVHK